MADTADMDFLQAFVGSCVQTFPDFARIEAAARAMKWKRVTDPDTLKMIGPADGGSGWKAWTFKTGKKGFLLSTGERDVEGKALKFCVLIAEPSDIEATRNHIVKLLNAKREDSSEEGGQRYATYSFLQDDKPLILNFIDAVPMGMKMLNVRADRHSGFPNELKADSYVDAPFGKGICRGVWIGCFHMSGLLVRSW